ncbi:putative permease [compost metagenome]
MANVSTTDSQPFLGRWIGTLWQLFWSTIPVYILAVLVLGAARVWLFPHVDGAMADSLWWLVPLAIVGTLFVIPTAAEIPIVQTMMALGMGTGPAVALLMTLPSISLPSLLMLRKDFDTRVLVTVALLTMLVGVMCGLIGALVL